MTVPGFPAALALSLPLLVASPLAAAVSQARGALVDLSVEIEGGAAPLFPARDGSGRFYVEAHPGCAYALHIANRSRERVGVLVTVDGLNAISGEREPDPAAAARPGRMYVLDPWGDVLVRGWRTSLDDVRRFTFVDERASYATRSGRANGRMGWIEAWVYREQHPVARVSPPRPEPWDRPGADERSPDAPETKSEGAPGASRRSAENGDAFPGTGWGGAAWDPASVVRFAAEAQPSDRVVLRYEYAPALRALGLFPPPPDRDRLRERERGDGFARPPAR